jgi:hypothetical protein
MLGWIDVTYIADTTALGSGEEWYVVLSATCFADCEVVELKGHFFSKGIVLHGFRACDIVTWYMMWCLYSFGPLRVGVTRGAGP